MSAWVIDEFIFQNSITLVFLYVIYIVLLALFIMRHVGDIWVHQKWKLIAFFVMPFLLSLILFIESQFEDISRLSSYSFVIISAIFLINLTFFDFTINLIIFIFITLLRLLFLSQEPINGLLITHLKFILLLFVSFIMASRVNQNNRRFYYMLITSLSIVILETIIFLNNFYVIVMNLLLFMLVIFSVTKLGTNIIARYILYYEHSHKDFLTDLYNHRALSHQMRLITRSDRKQYCYIFIDFNDLKMINDTYGHVYGDATLVLVANCLKEYFGYKAMIYRKSGDEFVVLVEGSIKEVRVMAEELHDQLISQTISTKAGTINPKVSIGIVSIQKNMSPREVFELADQAMYQAKSNHTPIVFE